MKRTLRVLVAAAAASALVLSVVGSAMAGNRYGQKQGSLEGEGEGLELIANIEYQGGTDMEFATIKKRDYAFVAQADNLGGSGPGGGGVRVIDITKPAKPKVVGFLKCSLYQADIQISHNKKTLIVAQDGRPGSVGACQAIEKQGFLTVDIRNPKKPKAIGFAEITAGSHNTTAHPKKPIVYNSNSDLAGNAEIQIWSIKNPKKPELVNTVPSVPHAPHDIAFNKDGSLAVTAAISHWDIFDTSDPENPELLWTGQCPGCSITHDAKFTPDGSKIIVGDEGGGGSSYPCPGGALYFYDLHDTGGRPVPVLTGVYEPAEIGVAGLGSGQTAPGACTSHVFDISKDSSKVSISWYTAGTRYLDISNSVGPTLGPAGAGVQELGWFIPNGGSSWSSKFHKGKFIYSNDILRGFDVYKITG